LRTGYNYMCMYGQKAKASDGAISKTGKTVGGEEKI
jgi:hypothetical protein